MTEQVTPQAFLAGRLLLESEVPSEFLTNKDVITEPSIITENGRYHCRRCCNEHRELFATAPCAWCGNSHCIYCRNCLMLGRVTACRKLVRWKGEPYAFPSHSNVLQWKGTLSHGQRHASLQAVRYWKQKEDHIIWAVCGSGKTEIVFDAVAQSLATGERILLATPRVDVVKELYPRFKQAFPSITITALYGDSPSVFHPAQLVIATTHQTFRFKKAFDFVIVDEVDAFPFSCDQSLQLSVNEARRPLAPILYLSATPSRSLLEQKNRRITKVSTRYHGHPLPLPSFVWVGNWRKKVMRRKLPSKLVAWLEKHHRKPVFLFVPSIPVLEQVSVALKQLGYIHDAVHAEDPHRHEKVTRFRNGVTKLLVTTTILERGVTVPRVQVAVLGAEHSVFSEAALVQISGRVGRSHQHPTGDIAFFHYGVSKAMKRCRQQLQQMNREGV
ncbi:DEAD/DEAH box helicase [Halalkalibacterium halodurans]|uniref:DEAD/DEAH box helicase n=1 Tax=Halalkalibacterium halodurans TaxID=86665 RepID=UPI002E1D23CC|nr:DEAD/DEAH box helicase [Halalkalibacterium halodurans]